MLVGGDDTAARTLDAVARRPGFAVFVGGDGGPLYAVQTDLNFILGGAGAADFAFIGIAISACIDEGDAVKGFRLGEGEFEFGRGADEPGLAALAVDAVLRSVGLGEVFGGGGFGAP